MAQTSQNSTHFYLEQFLNVVEQQGGVLTALPVIIQNSLTANSLSLSEDTVAISGSTAATLGDTGGTTGPATAAQNSWLEVEINGANYFVPVWK